MLYGGQVLADLRGNYVVPAIVKISHDAPIVQTETFAPILYCIPFKVLDTSQISAASSQGHPHLEPGSSHCDEQQCGARPGLQPLHDQPYQHVQVDWVSFV